jgi:hypothetical protein
MKNLVGKSFSLAEVRYRIVDVQRLGGDALIYAEQVGSRGSAPGPHVPVRKAGRTAFHYRDIAGLLTQTEAAAGAGIP